VHNAHTVESLPNLTEETMLLDSFNLDKFGTWAPKFPRLVSLVSTRISSMWTSSRLSIPVSALCQTTASYIKLQFSLCSSYWPQINTWDYFIKNK